MGIILFYIMSFICVNLCFGTILENGQTLEAMKSGGMIIKKKEICGIQNFPPIATFFMFRLAYIEVTKEMFLVKQFKTNTGYFKIIFEYEITGNKGW